MAVPGGDIVQRVYAVADGGATPIVELENRSSLPVAVAFSRADALTGRPLAPLAARRPRRRRGRRAAGPSRHRARRPGPGARRPSTPSAEQVARGWVTQTETGTRFVVPDEALTRAVVAARAEVLLAGAGSIDPIERVLTERRAGAVWATPPSRVVTDVADAAVAIAKGERAPAPRGTSSPPSTPSSEVLARAGETDGGRRRGGDGDSPRPRRPDRRPRPPTASACWPGSNGRLVRRRRPAASTCCPAFPPSWAGQGVEVYGAVAAGVTVGFALRWHGERPALLWDLERRRFALTCRGARPGLVGGDARGEALLAPYRASPSDRAVR